MKRLLIFALLPVFLLAATTVAQGREVRSFNDSWNFSPTRQVRAGGFGRGGAAGQTVNLPHTWNAEDFMSDGGYRRGYGTYSKQWEAPADLAGKRVFLKFEGAGSMATVLVGGKIVGEHRGPYNSFAFEITDFLQPGAANSVTVICNNEQTFDIAPQGGDFNLYGGLYRDVWMIITDSACISPLYFGSNGVLVHQTLVNEQRAEINAEVHLSSKDGLDGCEVEFCLEDAAGRVVARRSTDIFNGSLASIPLSIDNPHLWNGRQDPYLYKAVTILRRNGQEIDRVEEQIGFRYFWVDKDKGFFLNGKHLKLHGVCRHQDWGDMAVAIGTEQHLADYALFDEIGANALRLAHYPQAKFMFQEADRRGYVVWEEIPFVGSYVDAPAFDDNLRLQLQEMIIQNYNHPSIMFWGLFNEIHEPIDAIIAELNDLSHKLDPGRLTVAATDRDASFVSIPDAIGWNKYYGWYYDTVEDFGPFLDNWHATFPLARIGVSEYGGGGSIQMHVSKYGPQDEKDVRSTSRARMHPEEKQTYIHMGDWKAIAERDFVWGSFVWNMFDFASSMRQEGDTNNQNDKGLVTRDRSQKKDAFYFYRANWNKSLATVHLCSKRYTQREEDTTDIIVFTTAPSARLYINGRLVGSARPDAYSTVRWDGVRLAKGENRVEVRTSQGNDSAVWFVK